MVSGFERRRGPALAVPRSTATYSELVHMASKLADELTHQILSDVLLVPDERFSDTGATSPFSDAKFSSAVVLLVCKRWLRVGTPALYETAVIRSQPQAKAFSAALKNNETLGAMVKKLRLEGSYGTYPGIVAQKCPDIRDFCFTLNLFSSVSCSGLIELLGRINPRRVILTTAPPKPVKHRNVQEVVARLKTCIPTWTNLVRKWL